VANLCAKFEVSSFNRSRDMEVVPKFTDWFTHSLTHSLTDTQTDFISERELMFIFAIRPSVCLSSVTFVHPSQAIEIFGNVSTPFGTLAICDPSVKILRRSSQGNSSFMGLYQRVVEKCSDFGPFQGYISKTVQDGR